MVATDSFHPGRKHSRYVSHALVEVRRWRWFPFGVCSAVLLDISLQGFRLEFTENYPARVGQSYWLTVPLEPLGIFAPKVLTCHAECRWFDAERYRIGGVFTELDKSQRHIISHIVATIDQLKDPRKIARAN